MRTTVTLDPDVERLIRDCMKERGVSFKQALNESARAGLGVAKRGRVRKFVQRTFSMGVAPDFRWDKALAATDAIEDEELARKLAVRK